MKHPILEICQVLSAGVYQETHKSQIQVDYAFTKPHCQVVLFDLFVIGRELPTQKPSDLCKQRNKMVKYRQMAVGLPIYSPQHCTVGP